MPGWNVLEQLDSPLSMVKNKRNYITRTIDPKVRSYNIVNQENQPIATVHPTITVLLYWDHVASIPAVDVDTCRLFVRGT
jgi:hypothetical protein